VPSERAPGLIAQVKDMDGVIAVRHFPGASVKEPGDLISLEILDTRLHGLVRLLQSAGIGRDAGTTIVTNSPVSVVAPQLIERVARDDTECTWEEMESAMARESNMTANGVTVMAVAGVVAVMGIATGAVHVVVGAMLIAPGFEPLTRIGLGIVAQSRAWQRGLKDAAIAYATLLLSAIAAAAVLRLAGQPLLTGDTYLPAASLVTYWSTVTFPSIASSVVAAVGGAVLVAAGRALLTGGVMIALALVPTLSLFGMALVAGEWQLAGQAAIRWIIEVALVLVLSTAVMLWKRNRVHQRPSMM
jgi:uncharacterized membrane protein